MKYIISEKGEAIFLNQYFLGFFVENIYSENGSKYYYRVLARFLKPFSANANDLFYSKVVIDGLETQQKAMETIQNIFGKGLIKEV